jgi:hypothetical protein
MEATMAEDDPVDRQGEREHRLSTTIRRARLSARGIDGERVLFTVGAVLVPVGLLLLVVAWKGVANTGAVFEQVPFIVSGGLGGLALVILGGFLYFAWWQTRAMRESREQAARSLEVAEATLAALRDLRVSHDALAAELAERPAPRPRPTRARNGR